MNTAAPIWHEAAAATEPDEQLAAELERTAERAGRRRGRPAAVGAYERAARLSPSPGERLRRWVLAAEAAIDHGDPERAELCARNAEAVRVEIEAAGGTLDALHREQLILALTAARFELGDLREAYRLAYSGAAELGRRGASIEAGTVLCLTVDLAWFLGDREVGAYSDLFVNLPGVSPSHPVYSISLFVESAIMLSLRQELGFPPIRLDEAVARVRESGFDAAGPLIMLGSLAPILAQDEAALELFAEVLAECRERGRMAWYSPSLGAVARVQAHLGRMVEARTTAEQAHALAVAAGQAQWVSQAGGLLAYLAAVAGEEERCREYARQALTDLAPTVMSLGESWGRWALGLLDLGLGRPAAALEHLRVLENGPAVHQLAATRALPDLLEAAVRAGDRAAAEQGLSNRDIAAQLILSPRTVGHHLYKAYPKLGVLSRGELPALLGPVNGRTRPA